MITRREFGAGLVVGGLASTATSVAVNQKRVQKNSLMHVGGDYHSIFGNDISSKQNLQYNLRHGVKYLTAEVKNRPGSSWDINEIKRMRENCDRYGVVLEAIRMDSDYIKLSKGPERDREIDTVAANIRMAAEVGVKIVTYHWELIPFRRNAKAEGRRGASYVCFKLEDDWKRLPAGAVGRVTQGEYWERITRFLERIIPVAQESGVVMACHPSDPPGLPAGYQGVDRSTERRGNTAANSLAPTTSLTSNPANFRVLPYR